MPHTFHLDHRDLIVDRWFPDRIYLPRPAHVRILVVVEPGIAPGPPGAGFGLGRVVSYLRNETFGFVNFQVDFAERGTDPSPGRDGRHDARRLGLSLRELPFSQRP
jgi:hypothetical protein